ncbi:MAG: polysaccharide biosynthesis protein [Lutibacter sp.]
MREFLKKKMLLSNVPRWVVLAIDCYLVLNTFIIAYLIRFNFSLNFKLSELVYQLPLILVVALISFYSVGSYKGIIRHTSNKDAYKIAQATTILLIIMIGFSIINRQFKLVNNLAFPLSILAIHYLLNIIVLIASRFLYKGLYQLIISDIKTNKFVLIYGAGDSGIITHSVLQNDTNSNIKVVGFLDDDVHKINKKLSGLPIFNPSKLSADFIDNKKIDEVIISIQKITSLELLKIINRLSAFNVKIKLVPPVEKWINNNLKSAQIKEVRIEDLLGRSPIRIVNDQLQKSFANKTILVTGAAGSIGSELSKQLAKFKNTHLVLIDQAESELYNLQQYFINKGFKNIDCIVADVRNYNRLEAIFKKYQINFVYHAAAYKHVPFMEKNPFEAICVNIEGTKHVADLAVKYAVDKFVMVSTDKAVNPTNVMGATKRASEMYINAQNGKGKTKFITTRFGNVLGSNGSVIPLFKEQLKNGGPLTVTHKDITRFFMTIPEACSLVLEAGVMGEGGEIFVFDMGTSVKIMDLAKNMIRLSGYRYPEDIDIKITGLRPGEKIYEELLSDKENTMATYHSKIMIAKIAPIDFKKKEKLIDQLIKINQNLVCNKTILKLKEIVPEFISNNSEFEKLDKIAI